ncbi:hypothetical protein GQ55_9G230300 [Panicum hallii var. hallii]|uniref:Uncharacterized protein n=1 Tax=Panicum hallii var. hallii TaxID=1504633 RepID=A0A2T7C699_9POAL|nr:hypothetical protein GQ55_9G230300 [Panicum hallii var. hallii]
MAISLRPPGHGYLPNNSKSEPIILIRLAIFSIILAGVVPIPSARRRGGVGGGARRVPGGARPRPGDDDGELELLHRQGRSAARPCSHWRMQLLRLCYSAFACMSSAE